MKRPDGVTIIAICHLLGGVFGLMGACAILSIPVPAILLGGEGGVAMLVSVTALGIGFLAVAAGATIGLVAAWGLLTLKDWARWLTVVLAALSMPAFPIGTIIGGIIIWYLLTDEVRVAFQGEPGAAAEGAPPAAVEPPGEGEPGQIGPYARERIVLCSPDAKPGSQREEPGPAGTFFPGAKWVGAVRNAAERLGCRFVVLTTGHGMVNQDDTIEPYDLPLQENQQAVQRNWEKTIPGLVGNNQCDVLVFFSGGVSRDAYLELLNPIVRRLGVDLITFGRPNMVDAGNIDQVVTLLINGTTVDEIRPTLTAPDNLEYFPASQG
jgi:hypothetical protein